MTRPVWEVWGGASSAEERAKVRGKCLSESALYRDVQLAREIAKYLATTQETVCADDVRVAMLQRFPDQTFGNWMGSVFKGEEWECVGYTLSKTANAHRNLLRLWRLRSRKSPLDNHL